LVEVTGMGYALSADFDVVAADVKILLANQEPSTHERTWPSFDHRRE
jgi:hypothetical protein